MQLVLSITFFFLCNIWISSDKFKFRWTRRYNYNASYCYHDIRSVNLSHYRHFPWFCVWGGCAIIFSQLLHINLREANWDLGLTTALQSMMFAHKWTHTDQKVVYFGLYIITLSLLYRFFWTLITLSTVLDWQNTWISNLPHLSHTLIIKNLYNLIMNMMI